MNQGGEIKLFQIFARIDTWWKKLNFLSARKPKTCGEWLISAEVGAIPSSRHHWIRYMFLAMNSDFLPTGASFLVPSFD